MMNSDAYTDVMNSDLTIRKLLIGDLDRVLDIERQCQSHPWAEPVFRDCFRDNYYLWAACHGERLVGYAVVAYLVDEAHLLNLCVHPRSQGHGTGRLLLRHLMARALGDGIRQIILEVRVSNRIASKLYASEGFEIIGQRPDYYPGADGREDAQVMAFSFGQ
jgi:ribosomal-protein-alanine N-acetyltransferase